MDLNQAIEFDPSSTSSPQNNEFVPVTPIVLPSDQPPKEDVEEVQNSRLQLQKRSLALFWYQQMMDMQNLSAFKSSHQLPLARIKKIMKSNKAVKMISAETPILFSKACELFIMELTVRAWLRAEEAKRRTLQRCDIARAISQNDTLDFLDGVISLKNHKEMIMRSPELQKLMMKLPMSSTEFNYGSASKGVEPAEKEK
ncbi:hypothetical protein COLO4_09382 [Corchorus olitorius]|uniref:Core Histone H2A/H2B/H3 domain-containing protein n=1 Tax=Corchorus olitorius TaxID=93759 RepID=A0A1R3KCF0_9ROSI|nr:hypothetical protein COLO4_09382 [Corchorus olitorius]